tara:strand:- start:334 stop:525 length:192 start_codon:yes stop_codon:yes gene_type:complete
MIPASLSISTSMIIEKNNNNEAKREIGRERIRVKWDGKTHLCSAFPAEFVFQIVSCVVRIAGK